MKNTTQLSLLKARRFFPLFCTQFLGALNDNLFKNAMLMLIIYYGMTFAGLDASALINLAAGVFILPFFLFSAIAGQLAEKFDKAILTRYIKLLEIGIMIVASFGFLYHQTGLLLWCLFLLGLHSTLFGPVKYAILPQYLNEDELLSGTGIVEMGTFIAILVGQISGTLCVENGEVTTIIIALITISIAGYLSSRSMPPAVAPAPSLDIDWNFIRQTGYILQEVKKTPTLFFPILAISWFWFYGAIYLTQLPEYNKTILGGGPEVYTLLITLFSVGIGIGSLLCDTLSKHNIALGLVPLGSLGLSLFGIDLYYSVTPASTELMNISLAAFFSHPSYYRTMLDFLLIGLFGGIFIVPLYTLIQVRAQPNFRARAIAANNIINALFMVVAAGISILFLNMGISIPFLLLLVSLTNIIVMLFICRQLPQFAVYKKKG